MLCVGSNITDSQGVKRLANGMRQTKVKFHCLIVVTIICFLQTLVSLLCEESPIGDQGVQYIAKTLEQNNVKPSSHYLIYCYSIIVS